MSPKIESYQMGKAVIDGQDYTTDLIVFPDRVFHRWWREKSHSVTPDDLAEVVADPPEVLIFGQGLFGRMDVPADTRSFLKERGIEVIACPTKEACRVYNEMCGSRRVAAALHLTC